MKLVISMRLINDDDKPVATKEGTVPMDTANLIPLVQEWTAEQTCALRIAAIEHEAKHE